MRIFRFFLPFSLGAVAVLMALVFAERASPGALGRMGNALHPADDALPIAPAAGLANAAGDSAAPDTAGCAPAPAAAPADTAPAAAPPVAASADTTPARAGRLLVPVQGVAASELVDTYNDARGAGRRHDAIDIMAPRGTPVVAAADGTVMKRFRSVRGGITLYQLAPDRRTIYYYAHLDRYAPGTAEGQALRRGQVLGYVGNTGDAGPGNYHLHFEVSTTTDPRKYWGGTPQNPYPLFQ